MVVAPTKSNLTKAKASLVLSEKGFELLDKKRHVLMREMMARVETARTVEATIATTLQEAYAALQAVNLTMGIGAVGHIAESIPKGENFEILLRSVMGVNMPKIKETPAVQQPVYSFFETESALDVACEKFNQVREKLYRLAEIEQTIFKLAKEIEKTKKRTSALEFIQIPKYQAQVKWIQEVLEEKDREAFFSLKKIKSG